MYQFPCKDCKDRSVKIIDGKVVRCHSTCEKYIAASTANNKNLEQYNKTKGEERDATNYLVEARLKNKRRYERRK